MQSQFNNTYLNNVFTENQIQNYYQSKPGQNRLYYALYENKQNLPVINDIYPNSHSNSRQFVSDILDEKRKITHQIIAGGNCLVDCMGKYNNKCGLDCKNKFPNDTTKQQNCQNQCPLNTCSTTCFENYLGSNGPVNFQLKFLPNNWK